MANILSKHAIAIAIVREFWSYAFLTLCSSAYVDELSVYILIDLFSLFFIFLYFWVPFEFDLYLLSLSPVFLFMLLVFPF